MEHRHDNPVESFKCARVNKSIRYDTMHKQKAPIIILSCNKAPKTQQIADTNMQGKPVDFVNNTAQVLTLASAISLLIWVPFLLNL